MSNTVKSAAADDHVPDTPESQRVPYSARIGYGNSPAGKTLFKPSKKKTAEDQLMALKGC